ncbi:MAG: hypothetical protein JXQ76_07940, partial [Campylobacterales bacterium]|nr:hypothetical protein [Campylobacterales bacterium]
VIFIWSIAFAFADGWETRYDKDGIKVEVKLDNEIAQRSTTILNASLEKCVSFQRDIDKYKKFMVTAKDVKLIEKKDDHNFIVRIVSDMPWPMGETTSMATKEITYDEAQKCYTVKTHLQNINEDKSKYTLSYWTFKELAPNRVKVEMSSTTYNNKVPRYIVSMFIDDIPKQTIENFKKAVESNN